MPTATMNDVVETGTTLQRPSMAGESLSWALILPIMFFACHATFSFQSSGATVGGFAPGTPIIAKDPGIIGYVVMPAIVYGILFWKMGQCWRRIVNYAVYFKLLTALAVMALASALWSQLPFRSFEFGTFYLVGTFFSYYLVIRYEPHEVMKLVTRAGFALAAISVFIALALPEYGVSRDIRSPGSWQGIFYDKTSAARVLTFMVTPALAARITKKLRYQILLIAVPLLVIIKAHALTAFVVLFLYVIFLVCLQFGRLVGNQLSLAFLVLAGVGAVCLAIWGYEYLPDLLESLGRDPTLTGRTGIWKLVLTSIAKRPLLGYGFYSFWTGENGESGNIIYAANWQFGYAHNGTLEIMLQFGVLGAVLVYASMLQAIRNAWYCFRYDRSRRNDWYIALLFITLVYNLDEATILEPNDFCAMLYIIACCGLGQSARQIRKARDRMASGAAMPRSIEPERAAVLTT